MSLQAGAERSKHLRQKDVLDREERARFRQEGVELAPRWREMLGPTPVLAPGDRTGAAAFVDKLDTVIRAGGWTKQERNGLKRMRRKWQRKAEGKSPWFNRVGNPVGGELIEYYGNAGFGTRNDR